MKIDRSARRFLTVRMMVSIAESILSVARGLSLRLYKQLERENGEAEKRQIETRIEGILAALAHVQNHLSSLGKGLVNPSIVSCCMCLDCVDARKTSSRTGTS